MSDINEIQKFAFELQEWSDAKFGAKGRTISSLNHLKEEVCELIEALQMLDNFEGEGHLNNSDRNGGDVILTEKSAAERAQLQHNVSREYADCFTLLIDSVSHFPMTIDALLKHSKEKLEINKVRKWLPPDKNGIIRHIKEDK